MRQIVTSERRQHRNRPRQGELALVWTLPSGLPARPQVDRAALRIVRGAESTDAAGRPDAATWAATLLQAALQVLGGQRPVTQLLRWVDPAVYRQLAAAATARHRTARPGSLRTPVISSLHTSRITDDAVEASAVLLTGSRSHAAALRLEGVGDRWRCTLLAVL